MAIVSLIAKESSRALSAETKKKLARALEGIDRRVLDFTMAAFERPAEEDEIEVCVQLQKGRQTALITTGLLLFRRYFDEAEGHVRKINRAAEADRWVNAVLGAVRAAVLYLSDEDQLVHMKVAEVRDFAVEYIGGEYMPPEPFNASDPEGTRHLIDPLDRYTKYKDYLSRWNKALKTIGTTYEKGKYGAKSYHPLFPTLSCYWARHTWATIAASLDIPKETIAHGLGHGCDTVTDIYIDFNMAKVDEANRRIIDYVLYDR